MNVPDSDLRKDSERSACKTDRPKLRPTAETEARLNALRATLDASIKAGGDVSDDDLGAALQAEAMALAPHPPAGTFSP